MKNCINCNYELNDTDCFCNRCGYNQPEVDTTATNTFSTETNIPNLYNSTANDSKILEELKGFNWGAFILTFYWAIRFKLWLFVVVAFIPYASLVASIYCGINGNEIAWKSRSWESIEQFKSAQNVWTGTGILLAVIVLFINLLVLYYFIGFSTPDYLNNTTFN